MKSAGLAAALATMLFGIGQARAEGYALSRFDPVPAGDRLFGVQDPLTHGHMKLHVGLMADYAYNPLVTTRALGGKGFGVADPAAGTSIVEHQMFLHLNGSFALWERLNINVNVPLAVVNTGESPQNPTGGAVIESPDGAAFGDIRIGVRGTLLGEHGDAFALGVGGYFWLPTGGTDAYVSDNQVRGTIEVLLGGDLDPVYYNLAVGAQLRESKTLLNNANGDLIPQGSMIQIGGGAGVFLGDRKQITLGPEFKVAVTMDQPQSRNTNAELLLGAKYRFLEDFRIGAAAGPRLSRGHGSPDLRAVLSFEYTPDPHPVAVADGDGDGVADSKDACPDQPGVENMEDPALHGCPAPVAEFVPTPVAADGDGDGFPDATDACPQVAGPNDGCPGDRDGDGLRDDLDKCPDVAPAKGMEDPAKPGCMLADADGDGVPDAADACPAIKGIASTDAKLNGCPGDTDGDGVRDDVDACPRLKGVENKKDPSKSGCPRTVRFKGGTIVILQQVQFATGTAIIRPVSNAILDEVATVLKNHKELLKIEVQGHTDNKGGADLNRRLSKRRADAVMAAIVRRGVEAKRLVAKGYGPDKPIASNDTKEGRAKNRRVAFRIL
ncbi:MAG TPA: OmpA family protein, partial [Sorangium sp.]|nr:OmpA family protein [Sorangium sp.]